MKRILLTAILAFAAVGAHAKGSSSIPDAPTTQYFKPCFVQISQNDWVNGRAIISFEKWRSGEEVVVVMGYGLRNTVTTGEGKQDAYIARMIKLIADTCE